VLAGFAAARGSTPKASVRWAWLFALALSAAALAKESFALVVPAVIGLWLFLRYRHGGRSTLTTGRMLVPAFAPGAIGMLVLGVSVAVATRSASTSLGATRLAGAGAMWSPQTRANLEILVLLGGVVVPLMLIGALIDGVRRRRWSRQLTLFCLGAVLTALAIIPQLVLYAGEIGFGAGRYVLPAALGLAAVFAAGCTWLRARGYLLLLGLTIAVWVLVVAVFAVWTWRDAEIFRADSTQLARSVQAVLAATPPGAAIAIATDPTVVNNHELAISYPYQLAAAGRADFEVRLLPVSTPGTDPGRMAAQSAALAQVGFKGRLQLTQDDCAELAAVVLLGPEATTRAASPCLTSDFRTYSLVETVTLPPAAGPLLAGLFPARTVGYSVLLR
jgi:hypothetical protein